MSNSKNVSTIIKIFLSIEIFLIILSPKGIKGLTGYEGTYPNPQFLFMLFILPILLYAKAFDFSRIKNYHAILFLILLIVISYFLSSLITINTTSVEIANPLKESIRQSFNYLLVFLPFLFLKKDYFVFSLNILVILGVFEIVFFIYGILGFFHIIPIIAGLNEVASTQINAQSWTIFGFIPKWGGTFEETQILSTFFLICFIGVDLLETIKGKNKFFKVTKFLFAIFIIYCFSKATLPAFLFYLIFKKINSKNFSKYAVLAPLIILIIFIYPLLNLKNESSQLEDLEQLGLSYTSFGERLFHIKNSIDFMSENIVKFLWGLGPRVYGTMISLKYPGAFNSDTNCISVFTVLADTGLLGFILFLLFLFAIFKKIKSLKIKIAYLSILIACLPQISWGVGIIIMSMAMLVNYDLTQKEEKATLIHEKN